MEKGRWQFTRQCKAVMLRGVMFWVLAFSIGGGPSSLASQVEGIVDDISSDFWVLQSEMGLFKFKSTPEIENDLKKIKVGDRVSVTYRAEAVKIVNLTREPQPGHKAGPKDGIPNGIIIDDRAFYDAKNTQNIENSRLALELQKQQTADQLFLGG